MDDVTVTLYLTAKNQFGGNVYKTTAQIAVELERIFKDSDFDIRAAQIVLPDGTNALYTDLLLDTV